MANTTLIFCYHQKLQYEINCKIGLNISFKVIIVIYSTPINPYYITFEL